MGDYSKERPTEVTVERKMIESYVKRLFKRPYFPLEIFIALGDSAVVNKGDLVWANVDSEHPFDFIPLARIDDLVVNLPTKDEFLLKFGVKKIDDVTTEAGIEFWETFEFEFGKNAGGVKLIWE